MHINEKEISEYNAKLLNRKITPSDLILDTFWAPNSISPFIDKNRKYRYKLLQLEIEFKGNYTDIERDKSNFIKDIAISTISFKSLDNFYTGHMENNSISSKDNGFEVLSIDMLVMEHEEEKIHEFNRTATTMINLDSNQETPVILEIKPSIDLATVTIIGFVEDITLNNLTAGQTVIVDGEKGLITENGQNKWQDYDSWGFPKLQPGENTIEVNRVTLDITVKYKPRWI